MAEQMRRHSPYSYVFGNPIRFIDPDGMAPVAGAAGLIAWARLNEEEDDNIGVDKKGNVVYDDNIDDGNLYLVNEGITSVSNLKELESNSVQLSKDYKWIGTQEQMLDYVKSQWKHAEGGFDWFASTNKFVVREQQGQGGCR